MSANKIIKPIHEYVPLKKFNILKRFSILSFVPIIIMVAILGMLTSKLMINLTIKGETNHTRMHTTIFADKFLTIEDFDKDYKPGKKNIEAALLPILTSSSEYRRLKVFDAEGNVLWSDKKELIGINFLASNKNLQRALTGEVIGRFGVFFDPGNIYEKEFGKGLEVYIPIKKDGGIVGVIETYRVPSTLLKDMKANLKIIWGMSILGGLFIYLSLYWLVKSSHLNQQILEQSILKSKRRLENLIDGLKDGVALTDFDCNILTINKTLSDILSIPIKKAIGQNVIELIFNDVKDKMYEACGLTCNQNKEATFDFDILHKTTGKKHFYIVSIFPVSYLQTGGGEEVSAASVHAVIVLRDVTHEKELTDELIHSEKMAALGAIFPKVSHELRGPLNALELGLESAHEKYPSDSVFDILLDSKNRLIRICNDLLAFSRVKEERFSLLDLNEVMKSAIAFLKNTTGQIKFHKLIEEYKDLPKVKGVADTIEQVFINIIINASHAIEELPLDKQTITVGSYAEGELAVVYIEDNGIGIEDKDFDKIFDPFYTTKDEDRGTGLGMAVADEIAKRHGAEISFESKKNQGTTFYIKFKSERAA